MSNIEESQKVVDWLKKVARQGTGSDKTRYAYVKMLESFCEWTKLGPEELVEKGSELVIGEEKNKTVAEKMVDNYFAELERRGLSRNTVARIYGALRGFFRANGILFVGKTPKRWALKIKRSPAKDDLQRCVDIADLPDKVVILALRDLGVRVGDFVKLTYGDVREDYEKGEEYLFIQKGTGKEKDVPFSNFIGREATKYLRLYLAERVKSGEILKDDSPLIVAERGSPRVISEEALTKRLRELSSKVGVELRPHRLRAYFKTQALNAGLPSERVYKMGGWQIPGVGKHYDLPSREEQLESFKKAEPYLVFTKAVTTVDEVGLETLRRIAKSYLPPEVYENLEIRYKNPQLSIADKIKVTEEEIERWKQQSKADGGMAWSYLGTPQELQAVGKVLKRIMNLSN